MGRSRTEMLWNDAAVLEKDSVLRVLMAHEP